VRRAEIALVAPGDGTAAPDTASRRLRLRAMPFPGKDRPAQTVSVQVNGAALATVSLEPGWNELALPAYRSRQAVDVVVFEFGWAQSPREVDPATGDGRKLTVAFDFVELAESVPVESVPVESVPAESDPGSPTK
jgi:hypothetical protein